MLRRGVASFTAALMLALLAAPLAAADTAAPTTDSEAVLGTHFYDVGVETYQLSQPTPWVTYARDGMALALASDKGFSSSGPFAGGDQLTYAVAGFNLHTRTEMPLGALDLTPMVGKGSRVRVLDFQYEPALQAGSDTRARVLLSVAAYSPQIGCRRLHVREASIDLSGYGRNELGKIWFDLPCLKVQNPPDGSMTEPLLHQSGGRIAMVPRKQWARPNHPEIYVSTGDFQVLATLSDRVPVKIRRLLGSVLKVRDSGSVEVWATGLRNPQGLASVVLDGAPTLVASSHGPRGGDELVNIAKGADFGWPDQSYGTVYAGNPVMLQHKPKTEGAIRTATLPAFAWVPSIGPGPLLQIEGGTYQRWWGKTAGRPSADLLVSGMGAKSLYRVRWQEGAVRYVETISVGSRIRSMALTPSGVIVAGTDEGAVLLLAPVRQWDSATSSMH